MVELLRKDVIGDKRVAQISISFDSGQATYGLSKKLLTSSKFLEPTATFVRQKNGYRRRRQETEYCIRN